MSHDLLSALTELPVSRGEGQGASGRARGGLDQDGEVPGEVLPEAEPAGTCQHPRTAGRVLLLRGWSPGSEARGE